VGFFLFKSIKFVGWCAKGVKKTRKNAQEFTKINKNAHKVVKNLQKQSRF